MTHYYRLSFLTLVSALFITSEVLNAQNANPLIHALRLQAPDTTKAKDLLKDAVEDVSKRTIFSSTWVNKNGKIMAKYSSQMINYPDADGRLQPIDMTLHSDPKGWVVDRQPRPTYFHSDRSTAISLGDNKQLVFNKNCTINGMALDQRIASIQTGDVKLDLSQGIHKELNFVTDGIETSYVFDNPLDGGITITEDMELPDGCTFKPDTTYGIMKPGGWSGDYILMGSDGKILARLQAAECYDSKKHWCLANYSVQKKGGKSILVTSIPSAWLAKAVYPITLDPLIIGNLAQWGGRGDLSCIYPSFNKDSIQVTIPANITITYFTIDYSYASRITGRGIPISDGLFYFSTPCASTGIFSCANTPPSYGDTAGVCWLDTNIDFHANPYNLTCCYTPECTPQTFWLDVFLARRYGGSGCDSTTIWYTKGRYTGRRYVFSAFIEGYTDSVTNINYKPSLVCSNICNVTMDATIQYGVPPYTITHPWASRDTVVGRYSSCQSIGTTSMNLTIPCCPNNCENIDTLIIPPPRVVDFCGNVAAPTKPVKFAVKLFPVVTISGTDSITIGSSETLTCTGGGTYSWQPSIGLSCTTCSNPIASPTSTITYTATVISPSGCETVDTFKIKVLPDKEIKLPNVITPGTNTINDIFFITNLSYYPNSILTIYDRWGKDVYYSANYQNNWNGGGQSDGVYYYVVTLSTGKSFHGFFQVINKK